MSWLEKETGEDRAIIKTLFASVLRLPTKARLTEAVLNTVNMNLNLVKGNQGQGNTSTL